MKKDLENELPEGVTIEYVVEVEVEVDIVFTNISFDLGKALGRIDSTVNCRCYTTPFGENEK